MRILFTDNWFVSCECSDTAVPKYNEKHTARCECAGDGKGIRQEICLPYDHTVSPCLAERSTVCYEKRFVASEEWANKRIELEFMGVVGDCTVLVNGTAVAISSSYATPFFADISDVVLFGGAENVITVRFANARTAGELGGGITRKVYLSVRERVSVLHSGVYIAPRKVGKTRWEIPIEVEVENREFDDVTAKVSTGIFDREGSLRSSVTRSDVVIPARSAVKVYYTIEIFDNPRVWDIDTPYLYSAVTRVYTDGEIKDEVKCRFGFRTLEILEGGVILNGRRVNFHGVCGCGDFGISGVASLDSVDRYKIKLLREMGANAYRLKGAVPSDAMLDEFDECGMLALADVTAYNSSGEGIAALCNTVRNLRNHPSVFMWNLTVSACSTDVGERAAKSLSFEIKRLDSVRCVGATAKLPDGACKICEVSDAVIAKNDVTLWDELHAAYPEKPFLVSECASELSTRGWYYRDSKEYGAYSEYQAPAADSGCREYVYQNLIKRPWIAGAFISCDTDGRKAFAPWEIDFTGLTDSYLSKKDSYYYVKSCFDSEPTVHILPHWNMQGRGTVPVQVYTNCHSVELFLNGKSLGKQTPEPASHAEWSVEFTPGSLAAVGYSESGIPLAADERVTTGPAKALVLHFANESDIAASGDNIALIYCTAVDENGVEVPDAEGKVSFVAEGGEIVGTGASPTDFVPHSSPVRKMVRGRAICAVRGLEADMSVYASAPGLVGAYIRISPEG